MQNKIIIALVGLYSSGKDTATDYLVKRGFVHFSLSDILREICRRRGTYESRDDLIRVGNELRKKYGLGYLAKKAVQKADQLQSRQVVFSSVRNLGEISEFKKHGNLFVIEIKASLSVRYRRAKQRGKIDDQVTFAKFKAQEEFERKGSAHQQQLDTVIARADFRIKNEGTLNQLYKKIDSVLGEINRKVGARQPKNIIILGPQGSGKGTQASLLTQKYDLVHIETGRIFRAMAQQHTVLGRKIHYLINEKGHLLSSEFVIKILRAYLSKVPTTKGLIFDGYPRNLVQARALDRLFAQLGRTLTQVIYIPISRRTTIKRLTLRRVCRQCGTIFILGKNLPRGAKHCPKCHGEIYQRVDDKPTAIAKRLALYVQQTKPLITYYQRRGIVVTVDGEPPISVVSKNILKHLL